MTPKQHSVRELLDEELRCIEPISVAIGESCGECVPCQARDALRYLEEQYEALTDLERKSFGWARHWEAEATRLREQLEAYRAALEEIDRYAMRFDGGGAVGAGRLARAALASIPASNRVSDWSPGDVIAAEEDGTIVLDDGITTWNPTRAATFLAKSNPASKPGVTYEGALNISGPGAAVPIPASKPDMGDVIADDHWHERHQAPDPASESERP